MGPEPRTQGNERREISSVPFASQLDDIEKALFEYRYRKQNQQYHQYDGHHQSHGHHVFQRGHKSNNQFNKNGRTSFHGYYHHNSSQNHLQHRPVTVSAGQKFVNNKNIDTVVLKSSTGTNVGQGFVNQNALQQQQGNPSQQHFQQQFYVQQPQPLPASSLAFSSNTTFNGFGYNSSAVASSPDSLVEDFIYSKMSSSVSSGGSTSSYGSNDQFDFSKNQINFISPITSSNKASVGMNDVNFNDNVFSSSQTPGFGTRSDKSLGWLNIWGNDMSVWN